MTVPFGLVAWLALGVGAGAVIWLVARRWAASAGSHLLAGVVGALAGGLIATLLGFGGIDVTDSRSLTIAAVLAFAAALVPIVLRRGPVGGSR